MKGYILAHDLGTSGDKATLVDENGRVVKTSFRGYQTFYPEKGWAEQNADDYWEAFCRTTEEIIEKSGVSPGQIAVISFSGQMMAALPVDKDGNALRRSIIWADMRSQDQIDELSRRLDPDKVYRITGHRLSPSYSASKIIWIRENEPDVYKKAYKFIHAKDYLVAKLTSKFYTDYSDASGMNLFDINALEWSDEMLTVTDIEREKLPEVVESTTVVGKVSSEASRITGLLEGTPVVIGGGDGACATAGAGVVKRGDSYIYLGTSTWMGLTDIKPLIDPQKRVFTFCHFNKGLYFIAGTMQTGGGAYGWFKNKLCECEAKEAEGRGEDIYDILNDMAKDVLPGADGLIFLPYLMGERSPLWDPKVRGAFIGITIRHGKKDMVRAVLEGVAYNMRLIVEAFKEQGNAPELIRMIGGGAKSNLWLSIFADVLEAKISRLNLIEDATSFGAAIAGGVGVGIYSSIEDGAKIIKQTEVFEPDSNRVKIYKRYFEVFKDSYKKLREIFYELDDISIDEQF